MMSARVCRVSLSLCKMPELPLVFGCLPGIAAACFLAAAGGAAAVEERVTGLESVGRLEGGGGSTPSLWGRD